MDDIFVGRNKILSKSKLFLTQVRGSKHHDVKVLLLQGVGGIGKTKLATKIREQALNQNFICTTILDLKSTSNRSTTSLLDSLCQSLYESTPGEYKQAIIPLFETFNKYNLAQSQEKYILFDKLVDDFIQTMSTLSSDIPIIIIFDTFETVQQIKLGEWLLNLIPRLSGHIGVVIAGREQIRVPGVNEISLTVDGLSSTEIDELARNMFKSRGIEDDYDLSLSIIESLYNLTNGRPILIILAIEWILEDVAPEDIISIDRSEFESKMVVHLNNMGRKDVFFKERPSQDERDTIIMMATLDKRFDSEILSMLTDWDSTYSQDICQNLRRFFFIKVSTSPGHYDSIGLHDEMLRLVNNFVICDDQSKNGWRRIVVENYYDKTIEKETNPQTHQTLIAEKINYQFRYDPDSAILYFDQEMRKSNVEYELEFCDLLLSEAYDTPGLGQRKSIVLLNEAELLIKRYQPFDAKPTFDKLIKVFDPQTQTEYLSRAIDGLGSCIANGATVIEANLVEAIDLWKQSLDICKSKGILSRVATIYYQLGTGYDLLGQHEEAINNYEESNKLARSLNDWPLVAKTLDDMGRLRRKRYEVQQAMDLFQESIKIKENLVDLKSMGVSYHYLGDAYRDLDNFPEALRWYSYAEEVRKNVDDAYGLCVLYGDIGWLYLLDKNWDKAIEYTDKSYFELAIPKHFGREMAEMEHSYYHIEVATRGLPTALPWIEKAFRNAEIYSNTFIYLDAALHLIEAAFSMGEYEKIPFYYEKMDELDKKGCGYKMFRGRAINILGDISFIKKDYKKAITYWKEGFTIVGIHGRSRSSVLNFTDHLTGRVSNISQALRLNDVAVINDFINHWQTTKIEEGKTMTLSEEYPGMKGLATMILGDFEFDKHEYGKSLNHWKNGLRLWIEHMAVKDNNKILTIEHILEDRIESIVAAKDKKGELLLDNVDNMLGTPEQIETQLELFRIVNQKTMG
jgi:tetratricopeptide (TPR) repeat protein